MSHDLLESPRVVVYDTLRERHYATFEQVSDFPTLCQRIADNHPLFRLAYRGEEEEESLESDFDFCCRAILCSRNVVFAVEEVDLFSSPHSLPLPLEKIISIGRHRDLSCFVASRRAPAIHPLIRSQAARIISFTQTEPRDLDWCREVMGSEAEKLPGLRQFHFLEWRDDLPPLKPEKTSPPRGEKENSGELVEDLTPDRD